MLSPTLRLARPTALRTLAAPIARPFSSAPLLRLKEDSAKSPEEADRIKHEQLQKQKEGKGHWHEELASQSESHVAADRQNVGDHKQHMEDLQKQTAQGAQEEKEGKK